MNHTVMRGIYVFALTLIMLVAVSTTKAQASHIQEVSFCDLINRPASFSGKLVRTEATILSGWHGWSLFDPKCSHNSAGFVFDCDGDKKCKRSLKDIGKKMDRKGDIGRVKVVIVGTLILLPSAQPPHTNNKQFQTKAVESVERIAREVPWLLD